MLGIAQVAVMFLSYDPNFCYDDDDEEAGGDMDVDGGKCFKMKVILELC